MAKGWDAWTSPSYPFHLESKALQLLRHLRSLSLKSADVSWTPRCWVTALIRKQVLCLSGPTRSCPGQMEYCRYVGEPHECPLAYTGGHNSVKLEIGTLVWAPSRVWALPSLWDQGIKKFSCMAGAEVQCLRALATVSENGFPEPTWRLTTVWNSSSRGVQYPILASKGTVHTWCTDIHVDKTDYKINN